MSEREFKCEAKAEVFDHPTLTDDGLREFMRQLGGLGGLRCAKPALYTSVMGYLCERCADKLRTSMRNPSTFMNVLAGRARTKEEIARLVKTIGN
jgi:hypothetical protein